MDAFETIATKLDVREYSTKPVPDEIKRKILESARLTGSSMNTQHWRFILIQDPTNLKKLASDSTTGQWVAGTNFAVMILVDPKVPGSYLDGGRVLQDMEVAAWGFGVGSRVFTGFKEQQMRSDYAIPANLKIEAVLGFGYPAKKVVGRKKRKPLQEIVFSEKYGKTLTLK